MKLLIIYIQTSKINSNIIFFIFYFLQLIVFPFLYSNINIHRVRVHIYLSIILKKFMDNTFFIVASNDFWDQFDERIANLLGRQEENSKTWLRSAEVREMLNISDSTLQTLRVNRTIPAYKLGTTWMYKYDEIIDVLEANRTFRKEGRYE